MKILKKRAGNERGAALILFTLMLVMVVLPMVGLAIDGGVTYLAQSRLNSAVDAASLAGGRSLNVGMDFASQKTNAEAVARAYFNANFPPGLLNTTNVSVNAVAAETSDHTRTVSVSANASVKLYFMNMLNKPTAMVTTSAQTSKRDVNMVLVLDRSGSMGDVCSTLVGNAQSFVDKFSNGHDTVGLVTFSGSAKADFLSNINFKSVSPSLSSTLSDLACGGGTASADALSLARAQINAQNLPGALNVIVFFTDGQPTNYSSASKTSTGSTGFPVKRGSSCNGGYGNSIKGSLTQLTNGSDSGVYSASAVSISTTANALVSKSNCQYTSHDTWVDQDLDYIPDTDTYGNSAYTSGYTSVTTAIAGDGRSHIKVTGDNIGAAATNAADFAANRIRNDGTLIYTIGLDSNGGVDGVLLRRIANDPASTIYNSSQPTGRYYLAPTAADLAAAFDAVSSQILRIAK